jgi:hypothetical protein
MFHPLPAPTASGHEEETETEVLKARVEEAEALHTMLQAAFEEEKQAFILEHERLDHENITLQEALASSEESTLRAEESTLRAEESTRRAEECTIRSNHEVEDLKAQLESQYNRSPPEKEKAQKIQKKVLWDVHRLQKENKALLENMQKQCEVNETLQEQVATLRHRLKAADATEGQLIAARAENYTMACQVCYSCVTALQCVPHCVLLFCHGYTACLTVCYVCFTALRNVSHCVIRCCHGCTACVSLFVTLVSRLCGVCLTVRNVCAMALCCVSNSSVPAWRGWKPTSARTKACGCSSPSSAGCPLASKMGLAPGRDPRRPHPPL